MKLLLIRSIPLRQPLHVPSASLLVPEFPRVLLESWPAHEHHSDDQQNDHCQPNVRCTDLRTARRWLASPPTFIKAKVDNCGCNDRQNPGCATSPPLVFRRDRLRRPFGQFQHQQHQSNNQRKQHKLIQEQVAQIDRNQCPTVGREQAGARCQVAAVAAEMPNRFGFGELVRVWGGISNVGRRLNHSIGREEFLDVLDLAIALDPSCQPGTDVAAPRNGGKVVEHS